MKHITADIYAISNVGKVREKNEDNFYLGSKIVNLKNDCSYTVRGAQQFVCCVCDGMGGAFAGELASKRAVETIRNREKYLLREQLQPAAIGRVLREANHRVCAEIDKYRKKMGSTISLFGMQNMTGVVANLGDSRTYRFVNGRLSCLTHDHTQAQMMIQAGIMSASQAAGSKASHALTQYLGIDESQMLIEPEILRFPLHKGETYLLCTDGLYDMLDEKRIEKVLSQPGSVQTKADALVYDALHHGGVDNITVIVIEIK